MTRTIFLIEDLSQQHLQAQSVAAVLRQADFRTCLLDSAETDPNTIVALAIQGQPRLIIFSILFADHVSEYLGLGHALRNAGVHAHLTLIGALPALASATFLAACPALDSVVGSEPEATIAQLAYTCHDSAQWQRIPGIAYRSPTPHANPPPPPIHLDDLPFALRDSPISNSQPPTSHLQFATIAASRGCYHECAFCLPCAFYRALGTRYRLRSIFHLVDEIQVLSQQGTRLFLFDDEQFLPPRGAREKRIAEFADALRQRDLQIAFTCKCRADEVDEAFFRQLHDLGLLRVYIGIESGHQPTLDWMRKKTTVQQNADALKTLDQLGIVANFRTLLFHPWSTLETIRTEIDFLENVTPHGPTLFSFRDVEIFAGTPLAEQTRNPISRRNWVSEYTIADPRAELLRRLNRIVYGSSYTKTQDALDQAWFDVLLSKRFGMQSDASELDRLKGIAINLNRITLGVWREMLEFVEREDIYDAAGVHLRAGEWARKTESPQWA
ncbi:MAG: radical SAM protein [Chloroflexi bacterium]|nr:radical SAM protein [Chloroflexota bacterium]